MTVKYYANHRYTLCLRKYATFFGSVCPIQTDFQSKCLVVIVLICAMHYIYNVTARKSTADVTTDITLLYQVGPWTEMMA